MKLITTCLLAVLLTPFSLSSATISFILEGTIEQVTLEGYPHVDIGDPFRVTVSYSDGWPDLEPADDFGVYQPDDLSIRFDIPGEGMVFETPGGYLYATTDQGFFGAISIYSMLPNNNWLSLAFYDDDRSMVPNDALPVHYGMFSDYDGIGFGVFGPRQFPSPISPLIYGTAATLVVPEPRVNSLIGVGIFVLIALRCRQSRQPVANGPS